MDAPFRIDVRVRNNRILRAVERLGYKNLAEFSRASGFYAPKVSAFVTFRISPLREDGEWKEDALKLADAPFEAPEDLWPKEARAVTESRHQFEATYEQLRRFGAEPAIRALDQPQVSKLLASALKELTPKERGILEARFADEKSSPRSATPSA